MDGNTRIWKTAAKIAKRISIVRGQWGWKLPHDVAWRINNAIGAIRSGDLDTMSSALADLRQAPKPVSDTK